MAKKKLNTPFKHTDLEAMSFALSTYASQCEGNKQFAAAAEAWTMAAQCDIKRGNPVRAGGLKIRATKAYTLAGTPKEVV